MLRRLLCHLGFHVAQKIFGLTQKVFRTNDGVHGKTEAYCIHCKQYYEIKT